MRFNRIDAKLKAKASMKNAYPHPMLITLVYLLCTSVLVSVVQYFISNPFMSLYTYLLRGYDIDLVVRSLFTGGRAMLMVFLTILLSLYTSIMSFGYVSYSLRLSRDEQPTYRNLIDGFAMAGRVLLMYILISVFVMLWELLALVPYFIVMIAGIITDSTVLIILALLLLFGAVGVGIAIGYRFRLAPYFLLDYPEMTAMEAITHSKNAMQGWKGELFVLDLSFIGWSLLTPFTLGVLGLWLTPYMGASEANFYNCVVAPVAGLDGPAPRKEDGFGAGPELP